MLRINDIKAPLDFDEHFLFDTAAAILKINKEQIINVSIARKSVDARKKDSIHFNLALNVSVNNEETVLKHAKNPKISRKTDVKFTIPESNFKKRPVVVGFGPAGIFAAYILALSGANPIVLERGEDIDKRSETVLSFTKSRILNTESNIQFGEGGAGAFSDGKLSTQTNDPKNYYILQTLAQFGAPKQILTDSKPHIGTDMLKLTVKNMRKKIVELGAKVYFNAKFCGYSEKNGSVTSVNYTINNEKFEIETDCCILAVGHSARDVFEMLCEKNIPIIQKSFAIGVRIEHLQDDLNESMYGKYAGHKALGSADYKLVIHTKNNRTMYSFCMCPGGTVVPAASEQNCVVTNGMSMFARNGKNANSALLVSVNSNDIGSDSPLAAMEFQRKIESAAYVAGGMNYSAPISLAGDFLKENVSKSIGRITPSYKPDVNFALPDSYLPKYICDTLRLGIAESANKIKCFGDTDAVITGVESRSSSPVRILRGENLCSIALNGFYPCGEGAGYAGGIVSAAADGIRCALAAIENCK